MTKNVELKYYLTYLWSKCGLPPNVASWVAHCLTAGQYLDGIAFPEGGGGGWFSIYTLPSQHPTKPKSNNFYV